MVEMGPSGVRWGQWRPRWSRCLLWRLGGAGGCATCSHIPCRGIRAGPFPGGFLWEGEAKPPRFGGWGSPLRQSVGALTGRAASVLSEPDQRSCRGRAWVRGPGLSPGAVYLLASLSLCGVTGLLGLEDQLSFQWGPWAGKTGAQHWCV